MDNMEIYRKRKAELDMYIMSHGVRKWEVASQIGIAPQTFSSKLRMPTDEFYQLVIDAVNKIASSRNDIIIHIDKIVEERNK